MLHANQLLGFNAGRTTGDIKFVGGATASKAGAASGTSTIPLNSGLTGGIASAVSNGDLVIAVFATGTVVNRTLSITDGTSEYALFRSEQYINHTYDCSLRVGYKFVSGDTAVTFGPTGAVEDAGAMAVYVFRGVDQAAPEDTPATGANNTGSGLADPPSITPVTPGAFVVAIGAAGTITNYTFTSSDLEDFLTINSLDTYNTTLGIGHISTWAGGAVNPAAFGATTSPAGSSSWNAQTIALRPA